MAEERISPELLKEFQMDFTMESGKRADRDGRSLTQRRKEAEEAKNMERSTTRDANKFLD